ncbi:MAG: peptidoglycan-associated lipoprotein Pal [Halioglobus sp.]|nr:peptidoglycan-associated lipoprotein Pal [Halioglobus sp.]
MKYLSQIKKSIALSFCAALLAACASTKDKEAEDAAAAAAAAAAASAAAQKQQDAAELAETQRLQEAADAYGNVFYFEYDSSTLTAQALDALNAHIAALNRNTASVRLEGHTDERGTREYNLALGERRANAVRDYMVASGISGLRIETVSYGEERPVAYGTGEANWAQNRRVALIVQ